MMLVMTHIILTEEKFRGLTSYNLLLNNLSMKECLSRRLSMTSAKHVLVTSEQPWPKLFGTPQDEHSTPSCPGPLARAPFQSTCQFQRVMASAHVSMFPSPAHRCSWGAQGYSQSVSKHQDTKELSSERIPNIHQYESRATGEMESHCHHIGTGSS